MPFTCARYQTQGVPKTARPVSFRTTSLGHEAAELKAESERGQETLGAASQKCDKKPGTSAGKAKRSTAIALVGNSNGVGRRSKPVANSEARQATCRRPSWEDE